MGMYALVLVIGDLIDRIGRTTALAGGLLVMAVSVTSLLWVHARGGHRDRALRPRDRLEPVVRRRDRGARRLRGAWERGKLLGFNDLLAGLTGAGLAMLGGVALSALGVASLAIGGTTLVVRAGAVDPAAAAYRSAVRSTLSALPASSRSASPRRSARSARPTGGPGRRRSRGRRASA